MKIIKINDEHFNNPNTLKISIFFDNLAKTNCLPVIKPKSIVLWKICIALLIIFLFFEVPIFVMFGTEFWKVRIIYLYLGYFVRKWKRGIILWNSIFANHRYGIRFHNGIL